MRCRQHPWPAILAASARFCAPSAAGGCSSYWIKQAPARADCTRLACWAGPGAPIGTCFVGSGLHPWLGRGHGQKASGYGHGQKDRSGEAATGPLIAICELVQTALS